MMPKSTSDDSHLRYAFTSCWNWTIIIKAWCLLALICSHMGHYIWSSSFVANWRLFFSAIGWSSGSCCFRLIWRLFYICGPPRGTLGCRAKVVIPISRITSFFRSSGSLVKATTSGHGGRFTPRCLRLLFRRPMVSRDMIFKFLFMKMKFGSDVLPFKEY